MASISGCKGIVKIKESSKRGHCIVAGLSFRGPNPRNNYPAGPIEPGRENVHGTSLSY